MNNAPLEPFQLISGRIVMLSDDGKAHEIRDNPNLTHQQLKGVVAMLNASYNLGYYDAELEQRAKADKVLNRFGV